MGRSHPRSGQSARLAFKRGFASAFREDVRVSLRGNDAGLELRGGQRLEQGSRLVLFCAQDAKDCSVIFQLDYIVEGETNIQTAINWSKAWDGILKSVVYDLSGLAGKRVRFILTVFANGDMKDDRAEWLAPRILHK